MSSEQGADYTVKGESEVGSWSRLLQWDCGCGQKRTLALSGPEDGGMEGVLGC